MDKYHMAPSGLVHRKPPSDFDIPVAVIPYEDREQVERLCELYAIERNKGDRYLIVGGVPDALQAALREFADPKPPKLSQPLGVAAVVEDEEEVLWVRNNPRGAAPWSRVNAASEGRPREYRAWSQIRAARILSPGYDPEATS